MKMLHLAVVCVNLMLLKSVAMSAGLPQGILVWSKGNQNDRQSRKCVRLDLPDKTGQTELTTGEDIECQISPSGKWVAYAKAKLPASDYHDFDRWKLFLVSIEGHSAGPGEVAIDSNGYWPSWGADGSLYYNQKDGDHSKIMKVVLDASGQVVSQEEVLSTRSLFPDVPEINECFISPDGTWFAGRTRGINESGVSGYHINPPTTQRMGWTSATAGCMPYVSPDGQFGFLAGAGDGVRWGGRPDDPNRKENQQLVGAKDGGRCYHPGISTDGRWFMTGHSEDGDQNAGSWDIYIYQLDGTSTSDEQLLVSGGFNGWPHLWVPGAVILEEPQSSEEAINEAQKTARNQTVARHQMILIVNPTKPIKPKKLHQQIAKVSFREVAPVGKTDPSSIALLLILLATFRKRRSIY